MSSSTEQQSHIRIGEKSDRGLRREHNEDSHVVFPTTVQSERDRSDIIQAQVAVVADGIGGAEGGKRASTIAINTMQQVVNARALSTPVSKLLDPAIMRANEHINQERKRKPKFENMGTTVVAAIIAHDRLYVSHAGDSRAYLIRQGHIHRLTLDHTWVQEALDVGQLTPQQAATHPNKNVVKRYLGLNEPLEVDNKIIDPTGSTEANRGRQMTPDLILQPGDVVLLCTDGLTDLVTDREILQVVKKHQNNPQKTADKLVDEANNKGGTDNITAVVMAWQDDSKAAILPLFLQNTKLLMAGLALVLLLVAGKIFVWDPGNGEEPPVAVATDQQETEPTVTGAPTATPSPNEAPEASQNQNPLPTSTPVATFTIVPGEAPTLEPSQTPVETVTGSSPANPNPPISEPSGDPESASTQPVQQQPSSTPTATSNGRGNQPSATPASPTATRVPTSSPTGPAASSTVPPVRSTASLTNTPFVPTNTPFVPTNTPFVPTNTPFVPTNTPFVPTNTPFVPTNTPFVPTNTPFVPTNTPVPAITLLSPAANSTQNSNEVQFSAQVNGMIDGDRLQLRTGLDQSVPWQEGLQFSRNGNTYSANMNYRPNNAGFGQDYYWRVDVIAGDSTVLTSSQVWKFRWEDPNLGGDPDPSNSDGTSSGP